MIAGLAMLVALAQAAPAASPAVNWDAKFTKQDGWVGGDGAYSVVVSPTRTLWLFSDSFIGSAHDGKRSGVAMVNNAVGVQEGHGDAATLRVVVPRAADGKPAALIKPSDGRGWFWIFAGAEVDGTLYLFLAQIERAGEGAFGFRQVGQWLATVANPLDEPTSWRIEQKKLPFCRFEPKREVIFGSAAFREGDYLYIYGIDEEKKRPLPEKHMIVARAPIRRAADFSAWRFRGRDGWESDPDRASSLADGLANEYSVTPQPARKRYVAVYTQSGLSDRIVARTAPTPVGPWSKPILLYRCPEMSKSKTQFTYAAKAHASESSDDSLLVSYVVNSFDFGEAVNHAELYRPRFLNVRNDAITAAPAER